MRIFRVVAVVSLLVALLVACLTLYVRPWANGLRYLLEHQAVAEFNFADLKPGHFYENPSGNRVLFFKVLIRTPAVCSRSLFKPISDDTVTIVSADEAFHQPADDARAAGFLVCIRARTYDLSPSQDGMSQTVSPELVVKLDNPDDAPIGYKRKAAPTWRVGAFARVPRYRRAAMAAINAGLRVSHGAARLSAQPRKAARRQIRQVVHVGSVLCGVLQPAADRQNLGGTRRREVDPGSLVAESPAGAPDCRTDLELAGASAAKGHNDAYLGASYNHAFT